MFYGYGNHNFDSDNTTLQNLGHVFPHRPKVIFWVPWVSNSTKRPFKGLGKLA